MTSTDTTAASLTEQVHPVAVGMPVLAVRFVGETAAFVGAEEAILLVAPDGTEQRVVAHPAGGILAADAAARAVITGGDDGRIVATDAEGGTKVLATDLKGRWIDRLAANHDGAVAWAAGKSAFVRTRTGEEKSIELPSAAGGFAFAPKGFRLAVAHYNGVTLWFPNAAAAPERLEWKGSHLDVTFSPDGRFLVTAMQEPMLHGWRLDDRKHMRMSGYATKVRSLDWTADGRWLASSGSDQLILWPFHGKDGPMGKEPRMLSPREVRVVAVACHSREEIVAFGYADGMILLVRLSDGAELLARRPDGSAPTALAWSPSGDLFAFGTEGGDAGLLRL